MKQVFILLHLPSIFFIIRPEMRFIFLITFVLFFFPLMSCSLAAVVKLLFLFVWFVLSFIVYFIVYDYSINQVLCSSLVVWLLFRLQSTLMPFVLCVCARARSCIHFECIIFAFTFRRHRPSWPNGQCSFLDAEEYLKIIKWNFNL